MKLSLSSNISKLRKEHAMTQEQLAEALGVTFASVSKWERGAATPELNLIAQMADLFGVSFDALVGFKVQNGSAIALEERIHQLQREKNYDEAITEAEKALLRYPNDFRIVYRAGELYAMASIERSSEKLLYRCIELLERSILLLPQNTDPELSEVSIQSEIAQRYIALGKYKKGLDILKQYNVSGVHNALIAMTYTGTNGLDPKDAEPYMVGAFGNIVISAVRTMMAYANYYCKKEDYASSRDALIWLVNLLQGSKIDQNAVAYVDKVIATCYSECASLSLRLGEDEKVEPYLRRAYEVAKAFDAEPTYQIKNIKFCVGEVEKATAYDDLGESALSSVVKQITQETEAAQLFSIWEKIVQENACEETK